MAQLQKELDHLKGKEPKQPEPVRQVMYVPRERKLKKFAGHPKTDLDQTAEEFIIDARSAISNMSSKDQTDFLLSHLEGAAKSEVRLRDECKDAESIFNVLTQSFGDNRSKAQLLRQFYDRTQKKGESLRAFSHALMETLDKIMSRGVKGPKDHILDRNLVLRDQFVENVYDLALRRELKRRLRDQPEISFLELREEAIQWSEEDDTFMTSRKTANSRHVAVDSFDTESAEAAVNEASSLETVMGKVDAQQKKLDELTSMLKNLMSVKPFSETTDPKFGKQLKCFHCKKTGHVIRDCHARKRKKQRTQAADSTKETAANHSEN